MATPTAQTTRALKSQLRKEVAERLASIDDASLAAQSAAVHESLHALLREHFPAASSARPLRVGLYASFPRGEVATDPLVASLLSHNQDPPVHLYFPRIAPLPQHATRYPAQKTFLQFLPVATLDAFRALEPKGRYGIREPSPPSIDGASPSSSDTPIDAPIDAPLDVLVIPGVAFAPGDSHDSGRDKQRVARGVARLGHGAGYYDDFLARHRARFGARPPLCVGVALREQLVPPGAIPLEAHDELLDALLVG